MACFTVTANNNSKISLINFFGEEDCGEKLYLGYPYNMGNTCVIAAESMDRVIELLDTYIPEESYTVHPINPACCTIAVTYEDITEESAENGENVDHGFMSLSDHRDPVNSSKVSLHEHTPQEVQETIAVTPEEMRSIADSFGISGNKDIGSGDYRWLSSHDDIDYETGIRTVFSLHCNNINLEDISVQPSEILKAMSCVLNLASKEAAKDVQYVENDNSLTFKP